jgi:predicted metal-dependent peptidase
VQWQQRMAGAAQQAMQAGKLGGALARMVEHMLQPQLPWRNLLAAFMNATARDDYNYLRPSRREGEAIFPSLRSGEIDVVVALDTSGSVSDKEMGEFLAEINAIKGQVRARVTLHACDAMLADDGPWLFEPWDEFTLPREFKGGGGTAFAPVFDWLQAEDRRPDLLLYFTDADGEFPEQEPNFPVIWLIKGKRKVPWGQRIQLN